MVFVNGEGVKQLFYIIIFINKFKYLIAKLGTWKAILSRCLRLQPFEWQPKQKECQQEPYS